MSILISSIFCVSGVVEEASEVLGCVDEWDCCSCHCRSSAKIIIIASLCTKVAGVGALSALLVLNNSNNLRGAGSVVVLRAVVANARCAREGGLYDESSMKSVRGPAPRAGDVLVMGGLGVEVEGGFIERIILKGDEVDLKALREDSRVGSKDRVREIREAISDML